MNKYIVDANVALIAGTPVKDIPNEQLKCAKRSVEFIRELMENPESSLVLDTEGRILREYRNAFKLEGCPNVAMEFCKWAHRMPRHAKDYIHLEEYAENEFRDFPDSDKLKKFDPPDRKYIALAYVHTEDPPIVEATDSKWWGIREELEMCGIKLIFVDEEYIKEKYLKKIGV